MAELDDPVVVAIADAHGVAAPCTLADDEEPAVPAEVLVVDPVLEPPDDAGKPEPPESVTVGTLRGSQPTAIEQVGFAELVKKPVVPGFCCVG